MIRFNPSIPFLIFICTLAVTPRVALAQQLKGEQLKDSLLQAMTHPKDDTSKIKTLFSLANFYAVNDSATAARYADEGRKLSKQLNWQKGLGLYYLSMARIYFNISDYSLCMLNARNAYGIFNNTPEIKNTAAALCFIANSYEGTSFYAKSIENNLAALKLYESIENEYGIGLCYGNIGVNYYYLGQYGKAIQNYSKALGIDKKGGDKFKIGSDLDNIAIVYMEEGNYDSANVYDLAGIKMFEEVNHQPGLGRIYSNRGNILMKMYDAKSAEEYYRKSLAINEKLGVDNGLSSNYGFIGELYLDLAKDTAAKYKIAPFMKKDKKTLLDSAEFYVKKALVFAKKAEDISLLMNHSLVFSEIEERLGHYQNSLTSHKNYTLYKDSIFNDENKQKIAAMETERLTQTKDNEIALQAAEAKRQSLLKKVVLLSAVGVVSLIGVFVALYNRRKKIKFDKEVMEVEMKALRAQMNPHFISNALHSINNYVMENDKKNASGYLTKFASLMRLILENSREREVPLEQDLHALELYMQLELLRFKNSFTYQIQIDPLIDPENTLIPPMLLQPFAENAILHGLHNKENGMINIQVRKVNEMICCVVEDNGNGNIAEYSAEPATGKQHKSLGKKIINERLSIINRLKKVKATVNIFQVENAQNRPGGVRVELLLPIELAF
jgi:tetratricopeptide (TPR) repeat protein